MKKLYTAIGDLETQKFVQKEYTDIEIDNFKNDAKGYAYYIYNQYEWLQDRWNFQLTDSKQEEFFREIPIEDYVIKDGKLAGFYPYQGWKEQKGEVLAEKGVENVLWITFNRTEDMADNVLKFTKKTGEAYSPEGESCYKTFWRLYLYSSEGRLKRSNTAFRWDGKGTLAILGNMSMPYWEEDEFTPWDYYAAQVKKLIISSGITAITKKSFRNCKNIENIFLPATVEVVEQGAFDIRTQVCKLFAFAGSFSAVYQWNKNIEMVLLDIKKDAAWIHDKYGIDIEEEYHNYWKKRFEQLDVIEGDVLNKAQNIYEELQIIAENLQKREKILKLLEMQPCKEEYNSNEQRRNRQRKEYSAMIHDDILKELLYITKLIK